MKASGQGTFGQNLTLSCNLFGEYKLLKFLTQIMEEDTTYLTNVASFIFSWHTQVAVCSFLISKERLWMSMCM